MVDSEETPWACSRGKGLFLSRGAKTVQEGAVQPAPEDLADAEQCRCPIYIERSSTALDSRFRGNDEERGSTLSEPSPAGRRPMAPTTHQRTVS